MALQLNLYSVDLSTVAQYNESAAVAFTLSINGTNIGTFNGTGGTTDASDTTASGLATAINTAAYTYNGAKVKATVTQSILHLMAVENDNIVGPITLSSSVPGDNSLPFNTDANWVKNVIDAAYTVPSAPVDLSQYVLKSTATSNAIAAAAAGAVVGRVMSKP